MTADTSTCPSAETLAQYLDGSLSPAQRAEVESHAASCEDCFEQIAAVAVLETEREHAEGARAGELATLASAPAPARARWWAAAVAAVLLVGIGWGLWAVVMGVRRQAAAASLAWAERLGGERDLRTAAARRWRDEGLALAFGGPLPTDKRVFRLGVHLLDARTAFAAGDDAGWAEAIDTAASLLAGADSATVERLARLHRRTGAPDPRAELEKLAVTARAADPVAFDLGAWAEAGRLAALGGNSELLANPAYRARLDEFAGRLPAGGAKELAMIRVRLQGGSPSPSELADLARVFETILLKY